MGVAPLVPSRAVPPPLMWVTPRIGLAPAVFHGVRGNSGIVVHIDPSLAVSLAPAGLRAGVHRLPDPTTVVRLPLEAGRCDHLWVRCPRLYVGAWHLEPTARSAGPPRPHGPIVGWCRWCPSSVALVLRMRSCPVVTDGPVVPYGFGRALDGVAPFPGGGATIVPTIATTVGHFVGSSPWRSAVCL